jgi:hypothetical protein
MGADKNSSQGDELNLYPINKYTKINNNVPLKYTKINKGPDRDQREGVNGSR